MKFFQLNFATWLLRFYLMMGVVILAGFIGQWWLAILALPIFLSLMMGITFSRINVTTAIKKLNPKNRKALRKAS